MWTKLVPENVIVCDNTIDVVDVVVLVGYRGRQILDLLDGRTVLSCVPVLTVTIF